jgi:riboflavin synthase
MFTGIIQAVGKIKQLRTLGGDARLTVDTGTLDLADTKIGDSIAVSGVCLTPVELGKSEFAADVSAETLSRTTLGGLTPGDLVNLEKALTPTTHLGGHMVSGHVDGVGEVLSRESEARSSRFRIRVPVGLARYIAEKGSICVDGVSLTVNAVEDDAFNVNIVPHTMNHTSMSSYRTGTRVNIEVDVVARYLERLLTASTDDPGSGIDLALLKQKGFLE